jgi:large subunit ribosomal protein L5
MAKTASSSASSSAKVTKNQPTQAPPSPGKYATLHDRLRGPIREALKEQLKISNIHALPRLDKVVLNVGINKSKMDSKEIHAYIGECLGIITGLKPVYTKARIAISNFKTRAGLVVGAKVTLRGRRMEEFVDRLVSTALPRIRDFRGLPSRLDGQGNYAIGLIDHTIFPEIAPPEPGKIFGMQIQFSTTAKNDAAAMALLKLIGVPFKPERSISSKRLPSGTQVS